MSEIIGGFIRLVFWLMFVVLLALGLTWWICGTPLGGCLPPVGPW